MFASFLTVVERYLVVMYVCNAGCESHLARQLFIGGVTQIKQPQPPYPLLSFCLSFSCSLTLFL